MTGTKAAIIVELRHLLDQRIAEAEAAIAAAKESRNEDTKSSAGDKYETGREMMQMEINKNELQLGKALVLKQDLSRVDASRDCTQAEFGSVVVTDKESYFIAIAAGKVQVHGTTYHAISMASPLGNALAEKRVGDTIQFQGRQWTIRTLF